MSANRTASETSISMLEQGRARYAYECVESVMKKDAGIQKEYKSYVKKIPMMIKTNGLGAALAFMNSKKGTYDLIGDHVSSWLARQPVRAYTIDPTHGFAGLVKAVMEKPQNEYRAMTNETIAFFSWLKRFADGNLE